jgi:hypothetical protein
VSATQFVGFFRELDPRGPDDVYVELLRAAVGDEPNYPTEDVAAYLDAGFPLFDVIEGTPDPLAPGQYVLGGPSLVSDGLWVWRLDLAHYVRRHGVRLPESLTSRMADAGYRVAPVPADELMKVSLEAAARLGNRSS